MRSPHPFARIRGIRKPEGALLVLTAADLPEGTKPLPVQMPEGAELADAPHPVLADGEVRYVGQPVAAVVAASRAEAEDLAELVEVDYEPLAPVEESLFAFRTGGGDVDGAFAHAAHVVRRTFSIPRIVTTPIETRGALADGDVLWVSAQGAARQRDAARHVFGRDLDVRVPDVGGAFGSKGTFMAETAATIACSWALGRPVKWVEDRRENFLASLHGRGLDADVELALDADGKMLALRAKLTADAGAYLHLLTALPPHTAAMLLNGCYAFDALDVELVGRRTNKVPIGPSRGAGRPEAALVVEGIVEAAAHGLGLDPVELRRRNLVRSFPYETHTGYTYDSGDFTRCLDKAVSLVHEPEPREGAVVATGYAMYVERAGGNWESAEVRVEDDGTVVVSSGSQPQGQGHATTFAQIAADELGVPIERVEVRFGEIAGMGTFASRSTAMGGSAVKLACAEVKAGATEGSARFESPIVFSSGCYAATVEIERATGRWRVLQLVAVDDPGTVVNPLLAEGQVIGGSVQGLGECVSEVAEWDADGRPLTLSLERYHPLAAADVPHVETAFLATPSPLNPLGAKGIGEGGSIGALASVSNAIAAAVGRHLTPPFTAEKLWEALR